MFAELVDYLWRIVPGLIVISACLALASPVKEPLLRIGLLILGFILIRDAMTPTGLWRLGVEDGVLWLRFADDPLLLATLGLAVLALTAAVVRFDPELRALIRWGPVNVAAVGWGIAGGLAAAAPLLAMSSVFSNGPAGGAVEATLLPVLLFFALSGNLFEEVLFRGLLQGRLERAAGGLRAALISAATFAACHGLLASVATDIGWPLLLFTLYEGLICALLRLRYGVLPAALAHGLAIFLLAGGLV